MGELIFSLLFLMIFTGMPIIDIEYEMVLGLGEAWNRKNLFGKLLIILFIIWLIPAILIRLFIDIALHPIGNGCVKAIDLIVAFITWVVKLGDKNESK